MRPTARCQACGPARSTEEKIQRYGLVDEVVLALELGVGGDQVVLMRDLHAVAGVVDDGDVRLLRLDAEIPKRVGEV